MIYVSERHRQRAEAMAKREQTARIYKRVMFLLGSFALYLVIDTAANVAYIITH